MRQAAPMPGPSVTLGFILATLYGATFHVLVGGRVRQLALYLMASWLGFSLGHIFGIIFSVNILNIGPLRTGAATLGACLALIAARLLADDRIQRRGT
jgi:hypothetical protein